MKKKALKLVQDYIIALKARIGRTPTLYRNSKGKMVQFSPDYKNDLKEMQYIEQLILKDLGA